MTETGFTRHEQGVQDQRCGLRSGEKTLYRKRFVFLIKIEYGLLSGVMSIFRGSVDLVDCPGVLGWSSEFQSLRYK